MQKTWNLTYYEDGRPVAERRGLSHRDAVVEMHRLAGGEAPTAVAESRQTAAAETGELALVA